MKKPSRLMVMAGGTGGHVFPALAVAKSLQKEGAEITWLGTRKGLEARVVVENGIDMEWISVQGLRGKGALSLVLAPFRMLRAMWQSAAAIRRVQPDCVLGMGGFVAGPGGLVARLMGRPLVVHEQNAVAGLTNQVLAKIASRVLTGFPNVTGLPVGSHWVGNPVREAIMQVPNNDNHSAPAVNVLIIGGSQGAHSFNIKLPGVFKRVSDQNISIWHQSGRGRDQAVIAEYQAQGVKARVSEFIDDMAAAYQWADVLICRAGAMTVAECCAAAKPAVLVPYPFSAGDHQVKNAQAMVDAGAGWMILNEHIDSADMVSTLERLFSDKDVLRKMGQLASTLHKPNAVADVAAVCREYMHA